MNNWWWKPAKFIGLSSIRKRGMKQQSWVCMVAFDIFKYFNRSENGLEWLESNMMVCLPILKALTKPAFFCCNQVWKSEKWDFEAWDRRWSLIFKTHLIPDGALGAKWTRGKMHTIAAVSKTSPFPGAFRGRQVGLEWLSAMGQSLVPCWTSK